MECRACCHGHDANPCHEPVRCANVLAGDSSNAAHVSRWLAQPTQHPATSNSRSRSPRLLPTAAASTSAGHYAVTWNAFYAIQSAARRHVWNKHGRGGLSDAVSLILPFLVHVYLPFSLGFSLSGIPDKTRESSGTKPMCINAYWTNAMKLCKQNC